MTDVIDGIVEDCVQYWHEVGIGKSAAADMGSELESHLREAAADSRDPLEVVGGDLASFAAEWAGERTSAVDRPVPSWESVQSKLKARPTTQQFKWVTVVAVLAVILTATITSGKESAVDNEIWRWVWVGLAAFMSVGEIFTAGFFMLPFAIGAGFAAIAAWLGLHGAVQWVLFFGGTGISMLYLRRFMDRQDDDGAPIAGPQRYIGKTATVLEVIDSATNSGLIRVETEEWRASTDGVAIPEGAAVEVLEVRGTRLVVAELN